MFVCIYIDIVDFKIMYYLNIYVYVWNFLFGNNLLFVYFLFCVFCLFCYDYMVRGIYYY